jgi:hypothetical protein
MLQKQVRLSNVEKLRKKNLFFEKDAVQNIVLVVKIIESCLYSIPTKNPTCSNFVYHV